MSSATAEPVATTVPEKRGALLPMLMAGVLSAVLAGGAVLGAGFWLLRSGKLTPAATAAAGGGKTAGTVMEPVAKAEMPPSKVLPLEPMVVNLADAGGRAYLRASISLRVADESGGKGEKAEGKPDAAAVAGRTAPLRDTTLSVLGSQTSDGLLHPDGVANVKKLLREQYALSNPEVHVLNVYFTDFLVQRG